MSETASISPWPHRLAVATVLAAVPLLLFGGTITTLDAGMAIDGWWVLEPGRGDHFLLFYPLEKWFRDAGTFSEHTHRLFGVLVGNLAIATVVAAFWKLRDRGARIAAVTGLAFVCGQGALGGSRVLEASPQLAFLHGALAQIVFGILAVVAVRLSPRFVREPLDTRPDTERLAARARLTTVLAYVAIFSGCWLRHAFSHAALGVHLGLIALAAAMVFSLAALLKRTATEQPAKAHLRSVARQLHILLGIQLLMGVAAFWVVVLVAGPETPEVYDSFYPTLHVLFGALLLGRLASGAMWVRRGRDEARSQPTSSSSSALEGAA